jgi:hypothetical protein
MNPPSAVAIFCEDIRDEKAGGLSLIGVVGDNVGVPALAEGVPQEYQAILPKLCMYLRVNFDAENDPGEITVIIILPDGTVASQNVIAKEIIDQARATRLRGNPVAGLVTRLVMGNIAIPKTFGRITATVTIGSQVYVAGTVNFIPADSAPTA